MVSEEKICGTHLCPNEEKMQIIKDVQAFVGATRRKRRSMKISKIVLCAWSQQQLSKKKYTEV